MTGYFCFPGPRIIVAITQACWCQPHQMDRCHQVDHHAEQILYYIMSPLSQFLECFSSQFIFVAHNNKVNDVKSYSWLSFSLHEKSPTELKVHLYSDFINRSFIHLF